jgi:hypothetical protein
MTVVLVPAGVNLLSGVMMAALAATAASLDLSPENEKNNAARADAAEKTVDLCVNNISEVAGDLAPGKSVSFSRPGLKVTFFQDVDGQVGVRVTGRQSEAELKRLGEALARKLVQQYAYHRLVSEMKARNMNVVEEEVEEDGTVRMRVRVIQG